MRVMALPTYAQIGSQPSARSVHDGAIKQGCAKLLQGELSSLSPNLQRGRARVASHPIRVEPEQCAQLEVQQLPSKDHHHARAKLLHEGTASPASHDVQV